MIKKTKPGHSRKKIRGKAPPEKRGGSAWRQKLSAMLREKLQTVNLKKVIAMNIPYIIFFYVVEKEAWLYRHCVGDSVVKKLGILFLSFNLAFQNPLPSFHLFDLAVGIAGAAAFRLFVYYKGKNAKKYRQGVEYGSARWGTPKDIEPFIDPVYENNILLTQTERLTMNSRPKQPKYARNKNVLVIGGSPLTEQTGGLRRNLKKRHLLMMSLGGTIGTGLFIGIAEPLYSVGPAGTLLAYLLAGGIMLATMMCLGELSCAFPHSGSFQHYALMFIPNPIWSYTIGWLYWFSWVFSLAADLTAAGFIAHHYFTTIPVYEFCLYILIALTLVNLFSAKSFGECEYWLSAIKVFAIVLFIAAGGVRLFLKKMTSFF